MYNSVSPYMQSTLVCRKLDTQGYFIHNFQHINQSAHVSMEKIPLKYTEESNFKTHKYTFITADRQMDGHTESQRVIIIPRHYRVAGYNKKKKKNQNVIYCNVLFVRFSCGFSALLTHCNQLTYLHYSWVVLAL